MSLSGIATFHTHREFTSVLQVVKTRLNADLSLTSPLHTEPAIRPLSNRDPRF